MMIYCQEQIEYKYASEE